MQAVSRLCSDHRGPKEGHAKPRLIIGLWGSSCALALATWQVRKRLLHRVCKAVDSVRKQEGPLAGNRGGKRGFELQRQVKQFGPCGK